MNLAEAQEIINVCHKGYRNEIDVKEYQLAKGYLEAIEQMKPVIQALENIQKELGVPQPGYPAPVANAYEISDKALQAYRRDVLGEKE